MKTNLKFRTRIISFIFLILILLSSLLAPYNSDKSRQESKRTIYSDEFVSLDINSFYKFEFVNIDAHHQEGSEGEYEIYIGPTSLRNISKIREQSSFTHTVEDDFSLNFTGDIMHSGLYIYNPNEHNISIEVILFSQDISSNSDEVDWYIPILIIGLNCFIFFMAISPPIIIIIIIIKYVRKGNMK